MLKNNSNKIVSFYRLLEAPKYTYFIKISSFFFKLTVHDIYYIYYQFRTFLSKHIKSASIMIRRKVTPSKNINQQSDKFAIINHDLTRKSLYAPAKRYFLRHDWGGGRFIAQRCNENPRRASTMSRRSVVMVFCIFKLIQGQDNKM